MTHPKDLLQYGQSYWLDNLTREMLDSGELERRVSAKGLRGMTSNPKTFSKAIASGDAYDEQIAELARDGASTRDIYERLAVTDVQRACDVFRPVYESSGGADGFVSLEVSPYLAHDSRGTMEEARRLNRSVARPNVMIKIPGTLAGLEAIEEMLYDGVKVNITLLFAVERYEAVVERYQRALERRLGAGRELQSTRSVASFFLSRIDVLADHLLSQRVRPGSDEENPPEALFGKTAIASAKLAYRSFRDIVSTDRFRSLMDRGASVQRLLWASTSTKNPRYSDVKYVEPLIGRDTVNTMPEKTIEAFGDHGVIAPDTVEKDVDGASGVFAALREIGLDPGKITWQLEHEGVRKFVEPYDELMTRLEEKRQELASSSRTVCDYDIDDFGSDASALAEAWQEAKLARRLSVKDPTLWASTRDEARDVADRLGWLDSAERFSQQTPELTSFAREVSRAYDHVLFLGMGGSSGTAILAHEIFGTDADAPAFHVLDSTHPEEIRRAERAIDIDRTLFVVASKSGETVETLSLFRYFYRAAKRKAERFVAITDPGSALAKEAYGEGFARVFENPPDIGGRYSALSYFGLVPMALMGIDIEALVASALRAKASFDPTLPVAGHPAVGLGVALGGAARQGRDKVSFVSTGVLDPFARWAEQLLAESTGKNGRGLVPIPEEALADESVFGEDRVFVSMELDGRSDGANGKHLERLAKAGHPVVRARLSQPIELGSELLRWEIATAAAGAVLEVNPFDEPNVAESKEITKRLLEEEGGGGGREDSLALRDGAIRVHRYRDNPSLSSLPGDVPTEEFFQAFLSLKRPGDYLSLLVYLPRVQRHHRKLQAVRLVLRDRLRVATALDYGPRYLHSTGQLHKGGGSNGLFVMVTGDPALRLEIPGEAYGFETLFGLQALGDFRALNEHGRRVVYVHLGEDIDSGVDRLTSALVRGVSR